MRQHGLPDLYIADILQDIGVLIEARELAKKAFKNPQMLREIEDALSSQFDERFQRIFIRNIKGDLMENKTKWYHDPDVITKIIAVAFWCCWDAVYIFAQDFLIKLLNWLSAVTSMIWLNIYGLLGPGQL